MWGATFLAYIDHSKIEAAYTIYGVVLGYAFANGVNNYKKNSGD